MNDAARSLGDERPLESGIQPAGRGDAATEGRPAHALRSLLELSRDLRVSLDLFETTDLLLFNLMGQVGTARASLWLTSEADAVSTILRCHGFNRRLVDGALFACQEQLMRSTARPTDSGGTWLAVEQLPEVEFELLRQSKIALLAPLRSHEELIGWIAMGSRVDGGEYGREDFEVLETSLGMIVMALENTRLFNRVSEANRGLRVANENLKELDRLKSEFLNNVNHELRTPIAVVLGAIECALEGPPMDTAIRGLLQTAHDCASDLGGIVENLLLWSECVEGRVMIEVSPGDVRTVLENVYRTRLPGITDDLRELRLEVAEPLPLAQFDPTRLAQILDELIDNAVKFTSRGSRVSLRAFLEKEEAGTWVRIDVEDNGPGIPPDRITSLFRSFEQVDGSMTRRVGGIGLGLAFAHVLAERMGGSLGVVSRVGAGTVFTVRLPLAD